jgi:hypothetical protein
MDSKEPIPSFTRFLTSINCLQIPAQGMSFLQREVRQREAGTGLAWPSLSARAHTIFLLEREDLST